MASKLGPTPQAVALLTGALKPKRAVTGPVRKPQVEIKKAPARNGVMGPKATGSC